MTNLQKQDRNDFYRTEKHEVVSLLLAEVIFNFTIIYYLYKMKID
jgi:hypothetical protein